MNQPRNRKGQFVSYLPVAKFYLFVLICLILGGWYVSKKESLLAFVDSFRPVQEMVSPEATSSSTFAERYWTEIANIDRYLAKKKSPVAGLGKDFYEAGHTYGIDPLLLVAVSMAKSTGGKFTPGNFNHMGWFSGKVGFASFSDCIWTVANRIAHLSYYRKFRQTKEVKDFAIAYNAPYYKSYLVKLNHFIGEMKVEGIK